MKRLRSACFPLMLLTLAPLVGSSQAVQLRNNPDYPLQIVSVLPDIQAGGKLIAGARISVRNTHQVPCVAFAVSVSVKFDNGESRRMTIAQDARHLGFDDPAGQVAPGQLLDRASRSQIAVPPTAKIVAVQGRVDYVEMADGTTYGDDPDDYKKLFGLLRASRQQERKRLLRVYGEKGLGALLEELRRP